MDRTLPNKVFYPAEMSGRKNGGNYVSSFNEKIIRSRCTLWTPN